MIPELLAWLVLLLAALPAGLFVWNLFLYRVPSAARRANSLPLVSVLIPARNEERNIRATLEAVLANRDVTFEVVVLDDHSTDRTAGIVSEIGRRDPRVRLESAPSLPRGWCGKQHACHVLSRLARHPVLVFIDADVRLAPDALARMAGFLAASGADLASGVPRQETDSFSERLLLPLIHFVLLGFLPIAAMRRTRMPAFAAGCGQLFIVRAGAYHLAGGHAAIRATLHDGILLPRLFRRAGLVTDLFDATSLATCRMYAGDREVWAGLGKNATEGLGAPRTIGPMSALLLGGHVLPVALLLLVGGSMSSTSILLTSLALVLSYVPRIVSVWRFKQPWGSALLHPLGVAALMAVQWHALARRFTGRPSVWKGRSYPALGCSRTERRMGEA